MDRAIVIGIGRYPRFGPDGVTPNDLPGAVADAQDMAKWFQDTGVHTTVITSAGRDGAVWNVDEIRPTRSDVEGLFTPFVASQMPRVANRLYVYMAGHGLAPDPRSRALILADAAGLAWVPSFEAPAWIDWFANQTHFDELVLWMDCCATQALEYTRTGAAGLPNLASRTLPPAKVFMAFASPYGRQAWEGPIGPDGAVRGVFTNRLLRGLRGAAANAIGEVRSDSLANFLRNGRVEGLGGRAVVQDAIVPQSDDMLLAVCPPPTYRIRLAAANGTAPPDGALATISGQSGAGVLSAEVQGGWVSAALGVGIYKVTAQGVTRLIEIAASTPSDIT